MKITEEIVDYISVLSRLRLPEEERGAMAAERSGSSPIWMCWSPWTPQAWSR